MKKAFSLIIVLTIILGVLGGCAAPETAPSEAQSQETQSETQEATVETVELSLADAQPDGSAANLSMNAMVEEIAQASGGSMNVTYYPNSQLGNERDLVEGVLAGTVDMAWVSVGVMQNFDESFAVFSLPFMFKDYDHVHAFADSELSEQVFTKMEETTDTRILGLFDQGFRWIWTTDKEVKVLEDLAGVKLRTPESDVYTQTFSLLGANPTPMAFGDLFTALQTGVVAGYEVNPESTWSNGTYEAISYGVKSNHIFAASVLFISEDAYNKLNDDQKAILDEAAVNAVVYNNEIAQSSEADFEAKLEEAGLVINELDAAEQEKFAEAVLPLYDEYYDMVGGEEFVNQIKNMDY